MRDRIGFTEFSFGYAFTENLIRWSATYPTAAPHFPNLVQEGQLGYDVRIDLPASPLFFQFKLPELMLRETAAEIATHHLPLHCNFFRMALMRRDSSRQHQILIDLERRQPDRVFYSSPMIEDLTGFNAAYNSAAVHLRSALFSPRDIGPLPDNKRHVVSYNTNGPCGWFCSEPSKVKLVQFEKLLPDLEDRLIASEAPLAETIFALKAEVSEVANARVRIDESAIRERFPRRSAISVFPEGARFEQRAAEEIFVTREIARIGLGVEMVLAQLREQY